MTQQNLHYVYTLKNTLIVGISYFWTTDNQRMQLHRKVILNNGTVGMGLALTTHNNCHHHLIVCKHGNIRALNRIMTCSADIHHIWWAVYMYMVRSI